MRSNVRFTSILCAAALSTAAFAQSSSSSSSGQTMGDSMRQPGGLYDATPHTRTPEVSGWVIPSWFGLGVGARYFQPIVPDGFLPELNDSFEIGGGIDFYPVVFWWGGMDIVVPVEARWTFHLMPNLAAYAKISLGLDLSFGSQYYGFGHGNVNFWSNAGPGIIYSLSDKLTVQAEIGYNGFRVGVGYNF